MPSCCSSWNSSAKPSSLTSTPNSFSGTSGSGAAVVAGAGSSPAVVVVVASSGSSWAGACAERLPPLAGTVDAPRAPSSSPAGASVTTGPSGAAAGSSPGGARLGSSGVGLASACLTCSSSITCWAVTPSGTDELLAQLGDPGLGLVADLTGGDLPDGREDRAELELSGLADDLEDLGLVLGARELHRDGAALAGDLGLRDAQRVDAAPDDLDRLVELLVGDVVGHLAVLDRLQVHADAALQVEPEVRRVAGDERQGQEPVDHDQGADQHSERVLAHGCFRRGDGCRGPATTRRRSRFRLAGHAPASAEVAGQGGVEAAQDDFESESSASASVPPAAPPSTPLRLRDGGRSAGSGSAVERATADLAMRMTTSSSTSRW